MDGSRGRRLRLGAVALAVAFGVTVGPRGALGIVGGQTVSVSSAPWAVALLTQSGGSWSFRCSGVLVSPGRVLTAAHCVYNDSGVFDPGVLEVVAGSSVASAAPVCRECWPQVRLVRSVGVDPGYEWYPEATTGSTFQPDVAVVSLSRPFDIHAPGVQPVMVAGGGRPVAGLAVVMAGFGAQKADGSDSGRLRELRARVLLPVSNRCFLAGSICSVSASGDGCYGDSGSGLVVPGPHPVLIGIIDTAYCKPGAADFYTDVTRPAVRRFIDGTSLPGAAPLAKGSRWQPYGWRLYLILCTPSAVPVGFDIALPDAWRPTPTGFRDPQTGTTLELSCHGGYRSQAAGSTFRAGSGALSEFAPVHALLLDGSLERNDRAVSVYRVHDGEATDRHADVYRVRS